MNQSLPEVVAEIKRLETIRDALAVELIAAGWSWRQLGTELGIPGSNAHRKYAPLIGTSEVSTSTPTTTVP